MIERGKRRRTKNSPLTPNPQILTQYPQPLIPLHIPYTFINTRRYTFYLVQCGLDLWQVLVWGCILQDLADQEWVAGYPLH